MIDEKQTYKKFKYYSFNLTNKSDRFVCVECPSCERIFDRRKRKANNFLLCLDCYRFAIQKEYKCKICSNIISNKSKYCHNCFQLGSLNHRYIDGRKAFAHCKDCNNKVKNYQSIRCRKCYIKWSKIPKNNPMYGKCIPSYKLKYKNIKFRSSWEANFAKWLDLSDIKWKYESKTFDLGNTTYTPDFYLPEYDCYIEVKGWFRSNSKIKINLFNRKFKNINLKIFDKMVCESIGLTYDSRALAKVGIIYSR